MEYVTGTASTYGILLETASSTGFASVANVEAVSTNYVPLFGMPVEAF